MTCIRLKNTLFKRSDCKYGQICNSESECEYLSVSFGKNYLIFYIMEWLLTFIVVMPTLIWLIFCIKILLNEKNINWKRWSSIESHLNTIGGKNAITCLIFAILTSIFQFILSFDSQGYQGIYNMCTNKIFISFNYLFYILLVISNTHSLFDSIIQVSENNINVNKFVFLIKKYHIYFKYFTYIISLFVTCLFDILTCNKFVYWKTMGANYFFWTALIFIYVVAIKININYINKNINTMKTETELYNKKFIKKIEKIKFELKLLILIGILSMLCLFTISLLSIRNKAVKYGQAPNLFLLYLIFMIDFTRCTTFCIRVMRYVYVLKNKLLIDVSNNSNSNDTKMIIFTNNNIINTN